MNYRDALEIARRNPGFSVTRGDDDGFIVRRPDGSLFSEQPSAIDETEQLRHEIEMVRKHHDEALALWDEERRRSDSVLAGREAEIRKLQMELHKEHQGNLEAARHIEQLQAKIAKVSQAEWEKIKADEEQERKVYAKAMKEERNVVKCACLGEVENCARCDGRGSYTTDGYGNPVYA